MYIKAICIIRISITNYAKSIEATKLEVEILSTFEIAHNLNGSIPMLKRKIITELGELLNCKGDIGVEMRVSL
jgi:hypothetical protein